MNDRILKINELIKEELGRIILREADLPKKNLTTITRVQATPNLREAFVYISIIGEDTKEVMDILKENIYDIQQDLNRRLNMHPIPKIIFREEKETKKAAKVEELIERFKNN
jgi:ribosome-binding factor A